MLSTCSRSTPRSITPRSPSSPRSDRLGVVADQELDDRAAGGALGADHPRRGDGVDIVAVVELSHRRRVAVRERELAAAVVELAVDLGEAGLIVEGEDALGVRGEARAPAGRYVRRVEVDEVALLGGPEERVERRVRDLRA